MQAKVSVKGFNILKNLILLILLFQTVNGYPIRSTENTMTSEELQYPNGTVIGKYAYLDKEGNPINIKYYADDSSYGVELNSYRIIQNKEGDASSENEKGLINDIPNIKSSKEKPKDAIAKDNIFDVVDTFKNLAMPSEHRFYVSKSEHLEHKKQPNNRNIHPKNNYNSPDFEIFTKEAEDQQCGSNDEKVFVYNFVKEARKGREVPEEQEEDVQFCRF